MIRLAKFLHKKFTKSENAVIAKPCRHQQQRAWISDPTNPSTAEGQTLQNIELERMKHLQPSNDALGGHIDMSTSVPETKGTQEECPLCKADRLAARRYTIKIIVSLFFPFALQALDTTIVASALPWIASDFSE